MTETVETTESDMLFETMNSSRKKFCTSLWLNKEADKDMSGYNPEAGEKCRYCGLDLPSDSVFIMNHYNTHWRQCTVDNSPNLNNACVYESHTESRMGTVLQNTEDNEVSWHLSHPQNFQYIYSPQSEPSNLSVSMARCSPLNLTGRSKSESPITSPHSSPLPSDVQSAIHPYALHHNQMHGVNVPSEINNIHDQFTHYNTNNGIYQMPNQIMPVPLNESVVSDCAVEDLEYSSCEVTRRKHRVEREVKCSLCNKNFTSKLPFEEHWCLYHSRPVLENSENFLLNPQPVEPTDHISSNPIITNKPYKCSICDQEFSLKEELSEHVSIHEASKPFKCDVCGARLSRVSALRRHILTHSTYKPHTCDICGRGFLQKCDLARHCSIHKKKNIQCSQCKKTFVSEHYKKTHKCDSSENEKPFKCTICGYCSPTNIAWSYHMWKHTKNPIFVPFQNKRGSSQIVSVNVAAQNMLVTSDTNEKIN